MILILSEILQLDGNETVSENMKNKSSNFRLIEANINSLKGKKEEFKVRLETKKSILYCISVN